MREQKPQHGQTEFRLNHTCLMHLQANVDAAATPISVSAESLGGKQTFSYSLSINRLLVRPLFLARSVGTQPPDRHREYLLQT